MGKRKHESNKNEPKSKKANARAGKNIATGDGEHMRPVVTIENGENFSLKKCKLSGLRLVSPYFRFFRTNAKGRWLRRNLVDVFSGEFNRLSVNYIVNLKKVFH
jgi:hypothetical protein